MTRICNKFGKSIVAYYKGRKFRARLANREDFILLLARRERMVNPMAGCEKVLFAIRSAMSKEGVSMGVSKKFCRAEYDGIKAWLRRLNGDRVDAIIPIWEEASRWPGHIVAVMDYQAIDAEPEEEPWRVQAQFWNEGYRYWWLLSNIRKLPDPFPCRGNVGMWQLPEELITAVSMSKNGGER